MLFNLKKNSKTAVILYFINKSDILLPFAGLPTVTLKAVLNLVRNQERYLGPLPTS